MEVVFAAGPPQGENAVGGIAPHREPHEVGERGGYSAGMEVVFAAGPPQGENAVGGIAPHREPHEVGE